MLIAPVLGVLMTLSFAPFDLAWLSFIALPGLFLVADRGSVKHAAWSGFLFGLGWFGSGVSWVFVSIYDHGGEQLWMALAATLLFVLLWSIFPALSMGLARWLKARLPASILLLPAAWLAVEAIRGMWFLQGFPWLLAGYSQIDTPLAGFAPVLGVYGLTFVLALLANSLAWMSQYPQHRPVLACLLLIVAGLSLAGTQWTWTRSQGSLMVSVAQGNIAQRDKWQPQHRNATLDRYVSLTEAHWQPLVVWPEAAIPAFYHEVSPGFLDYLDELAQAKQATVLTGLPVKREDGRRFNAALAVGQSQGWYFKKHLLPFGEYLPWADTLEPWVARLNLPLGHFSAGDAQQPLLSVAGQRLILSICYEDVFPATARELNDARFLVNITNDAWFGRSIELAQHGQIARMRALESERYLVRAANTGLTAIINHKGRLQTSAPLFTATIISGQIDLRSGLTPFSRVGDAGIVTGLLTLCVLQLLISAWRARNSSVSL
ncbi:MAG: apolipoprotein N-acyltransferase [Methylococcales bacterium]|nr:apolipoprotein N-acyltransferase [Methylococcales bacterium]